MCPHPAQQLKKKRNYKKKKSNRLLVKYSRLQIFISSPTWNSLDYWNKKVRNDGGKNKEHLIHNIMQSMYYKFEIL
jgi:hypothetical protein